MKNWEEDPARDRRLIFRHELRTRLRVRIWKSSQPECRAESINLSERGVYFESDFAYKKGEILEILLKMPEEVTGTPATEWRCTGAVVRAEQNPSTMGKTGVGVEFYCYQVLPSEAPEIRPGVLSHRPVSFQIDRWQAPRSTSVLPAKRSLRI